MGYLSSNGRISLRDPLRALRNQLVPAQHTCVARACASRAAGLRSTESDFRLPRRLGSASCPCISISAALATVGQSGGMSDCVIGDVIGNLGTAERQRTAPASPQEES